MDFINHREGVRKGRLFVLSLLRDLKEVDSSDGALKILTEEYQCNYLDRVNLRDKAGYLMIVRKFDSTKNQESVSGLDICDREVISTELTRDSLSEMDDLTQNMLSKGYVLGLPLTEENNEAVVFVSTEDIILCQDSDGYIVSRLNEIYRQLGQHADYCEP